MGMEGMKCLKLYPKQEQMDTSNYSISAQERQFAIDHLTRTGKAFVDSIRDLTEAQWQMRPGPGQWSASECADHILQTELYFFMPTMESMLAQAPDPARMVETAGKDALCISSMESRAHKIKGQPWDETADKKIDKADLIRQFEEKRAAIIDWFAASNAAFRVHYTTFPGLDTIDVYQFILMISAHTTRHTNQIEEIKQLDFFPKAQMA
jgi:hypothetical protein